MIKKMSFSSVLIKWFNTNKRELPWRKSKDPYRVWLSEIILQQTKIKQGLPYYNKLIKNYPTVYDLAYTTEDKILKNWQGLGYYTRARNLHYTAKFIVEKLDGVFPKKYRDLLLYLPKRHMKTVALPRPMILLGQDKHF